jgi:flagellar basal-body rod modification protein FlgD
MDTGPITALSSLPPSGQTAVAKKKELGKDEFLRLLMAQLQNQNPLSPSDPSQFVAQLAQFSSVEQMSNVSGRLDQLLVAQGSAGRLSAAALVGREIAFDADAVPVTSGQATRVEAVLPAAADQVTALVTDASGRVVRTLDLGARDAGALAVEWDGRDEDGQPAPSGSYAIRLSATRDGETVALAARARAVARGVSFAGDEPALLVGGGVRVPLSKVQEVLQAG